MIKGGSVTDVASSIEVPYVNLSLQHQRIKDEILNAVNSVLDHGQFILGPEVASFEDEFIKCIYRSELKGNLEAVALNSGTDALILSLKALGIGPGDEVITAPNSFVASASCASIVGARPTFVDVDDSYNMDPNKLEAAITSYTKAIIPVHLTGRPVDMYPVMKIAKKHNLFVVEDCAQAILAKYKGHFVGTFGDVGCFSFHPLKTLNACGDGGVILTPSKEIAEKVRLYRNLGLLTRDNCVEWCSNSRLDAIQAAILKVKLKYLPQWTQKRRHNAMLYRTLLKDIPQVIAPSDYEYSVYHTFVVLAKERNQLQVFLAENGIGTSVHYPKPIHQQSVAKGLNYGVFPVAESQANQILSLPIHQDLEEFEIRYVVEKIREFYK